MLHTRSRWLLAANRPPFGRAALCGGPPWESHAFSGFPIGEARLLAFANGRGGAEPQRDPMDIIAQGMAPPEGGQRTPASPDVPNLLQQETHGAVQGAVGGAEQVRPSAELAERAENAHKAFNEVFELFNTVDPEAIEKIDAKLRSDFAAKGQKFPEEDPIDEHDPQAAVKKLSRNQHRRQEHDRSSDLWQALKKSGELEDWEDMMTKIRTEQKKLAGMKTIAGDMQKWEQGELTPDQFVGLVTSLYKDQDNGLEVIKNVRDFIASQDPADLAALERPSQEGEMMTALEQWKKGGITPSKFRDAVAGYLGTESPETLEAMEQVMGQHAETIRLWESQDPNKQAINESDKQQVIRELSEAAHAADMQQRIERNRELRKQMSDIARLDDISRVTNDHLKMWEGKIQEIKKLMQDRMTELEEKGLRKREEDVHAAQASGHGVKFFESLGIKFYSVNDILEAFKQVKEAYTKTYHDHVHHKGAALAKNVGGIAKYLPFASGIDIVLNEQLEAANKKSTNEFKEYLKEQNFTFKQLFDGPNALMETEHHDVNHVRGILEYAASRGWLYDIDACLTDDRKTVLGHDLHGMLTDWDESQVLNYYTLLRGQNSSGREEEIKKGENRVHDIENIPFYISEIDRELEKGNIWAATGFAQRAVERGLIGEVTPWLSTAFFRRMREDPILRRFMPRMALDKIGQLSLYRTAFTLGHFKGERRQLEQWLRSGKDIREAGALGKVISATEQDIKSKCSADLSTEQGKHLLDRLVGKVLSTETLSKDTVIEGKSLRDLVGWKAGETVSILDDRYNAYRNSGYIQQLGDLMPGVEKEDIDYFQNRCENMLTSVRHIDQIFQPDGRGGLSHADRAAHFMTQILLYYKELDDAGLHGEAESFRREMGAKLATSITKSVADSRSPGIEKEPLRGPLAGKFGLGTLLYEGFIDIQPIIDSYFYKRGGAELARSLLEENSKQVGADGLLFDLRAARERYEKPTSVAEKQAAERQLNTILQGWRAKLQGATGRPPVLARAERKEPTAGRGERAA